MSKKLDKISIDEYEKLTEEEKCIKAKSDWNKFYNSCNDEQKEDLLYLSKMTAYEQANIKSSLAELKAENERLEADNEKLEIYNNRLSQGIYWGNGEQFCDVVRRLKQQLKKKDEEIEKLLRLVKCWSDECERKFTLLQDNTHDICEKIRERYNLEGKPIVNVFGDTSYGYVMVSAKDLKEFLDQIDKGENYE